MSEIERPPPAIDQAYAHYVSTKIGDVASYDNESFQRFRRTYARYLRGWLPPRKDAAILDAGCGHGNMLRALRAWGYTRTAGVDLSSEQVALARQEFPQVLQGDVLAFLKEHAEAYDLILAIDLFEHLSLDEALGFLKACYASLRETGRLVMQMPNAGSLRGGELAWGDMTHCRAYAAPAVQQMLKLGGFQDIEFRETGPVPLGALSLARWALWRCVRYCLFAYDLIETGRAARVWTRTMLVSALKETKR